MENFKELVHRAILNVKAPIGTVHYTRQFCVRDAFGIGSSSAYNLCMEFGFDPDEVIKGQVCDVCSEREDEEE